MCLLILSIVRDVQVCVSQPLTRAHEQCSRFAAKEAVIKAHPHRRLTFQCITIARMSFRNSSSGPSLSDSSGSTQNSAIEQDEAKDGTSIPQSGPLVALIEGDDVHADVYASVSISHDTDYATAVCLAVNPDPTTLPKS